MNEWMDKINYIKKKNKEPVEMISIKKENETF